MIDIGAELQRAFDEGYEKGKADRPQGDVDAVDIFEREMHNLEQGYITLGEFDERIEPLRHLCYGRPQGEWIDIGGYEVCKNCYEVKRFPHWNFCPNCGADMADRKTENSSEKPNNSERSSE